MRCGADDRQALEQLCRCITRPALANERVQTSATGQVVLKRSHPGATAPRIWATPNVKLPTADGRHMLDNMLYSLRLLQVDPRNPQRFPQASALEAWYRAHVS